jgi:hypothetical protein
MSIQVCAECHKPFNVDGLFATNLCPRCERIKDKDTVTNFDSDNWIRFIKQLRDRDWTPAQLNCPRHTFEKVPKSGRYLGISLWRCLYCDGVVQSS